MNAIRLVVAVLGGWLVGAQSALALDPTPLPVEDSGLLLVAAVALAAVIKIARGRK